jgi:plastocyanin
MNRDMNKIITPALITISVMLVAVLVITMPSNAVAFFDSSFRNFNANIVYIGSSSSSNDIATAPIVHSDIDSTPIAAVITISKGPQNTTIYNPQNTTIKIGEEILIVNNSSSPHSVTNGNGPTDTLSGKLFDTGIINPGAFTEYVASNLQPGNYPYYSTSDPSVRGEIIIEGNRQ